MAELRPGARDLREDDVGRSLALARRRRDLQVLVMDALGRDGRSQADDVRNGRLVVTARKEPPDQEPGRDEEQQQEQPQPPVALPRRARRLDDLLLRRQQLPKHLVDAPGARGPPSAAGDPDQPLSPPPRRRSPETIPRPGGASQRSRNR